MSKDPQQTEIEDEEMPPEWEAIINTEHGFWYYHGWWTILLLLLCGSSIYFGATTWKDNQEIIQRETDTQRRMSALQSKVREWESWGKMIQPQIIAENSPSKPAAHYGLGNNSDDDDANAATRNYSPIINGADAQEWHAKYTYAASKYNKLIGDYTKIHRKYIELVGGHGKDKGIVTGAQFLKELINNAKESRRKVEETISRGGDRRSIEAKRRESEEMWDRGIWVKKIGKEMGIYK